MKNLTIAAGSVSAILGLAVLVGWHSQTLVLIQLHPSFVPMQYNTGVGFILSGLGLLSVVYGFPRSATAFGAVVAALGILTLFQYVFAVDFGIDQLLMKHYITVETSHPGRMAPNTALCFSLTGFALLIRGCMREHRWTALLTGTLGSLVLGLSFVAASGYVLGLETAYGWGALTQMALHTSVGFIVLGIGLFSFSGSKDWAIDFRSGDHKRVLALIAVMTVVAFAVMGTVGAILYNSAFYETMERLSETARSHARIMEAVARFDIKHASDYHENAKTATISQIKEGLAPLSGTIEITIGKREGDNIVFLVRQKAFLRYEPAPVPFLSTLAEPMRRALLGKSGTIVGLDYRNVNVLAAHESVDVLDLGIVVKIDMAEIREPFIRAASVAGVIAIFIIFIGVGAFQFISNPMIRRMRQAQASLQESEQRYMRLVDNTPAGIWQITPDGKTVYINDALTRMFELDDPEEAVGRFFADFVTPDSAERIRKQLPKREKGFSSQYEVEIVGKKGGKRIVLLTGSPLFSEDGEMVGRIATLIDISERKAAEQALGKKTGLVELLRQITISANDTESVNEALRSCIESICAYTGWPVGHAYILADDGTGELVSSKIWHLDHPKKFETFRRITEETRFSPEIGMVGRVLASKLPMWVPDVTEDSNFIRTKPSKNIGVKGAFALPVLTGETVAAVLEFFFTEAVEPDQALLEVMSPIGKQLGRVIERKEAEAELRKLSQVVEQGQISVLITGTDAVIEYVNPKLLEASGYSSEELIGQNPRIFQSGRTPLETYQDLWATITSGRTWRGELENKRKNGEIFWEYAIISPVKGPDGTITHYLGLKEDITERKQAEAQVIQSAKLATLGEMATSVAHELNQPLNVIRMAAGNVMRKLEKGKVDPAYLNDKLNRIAGQTERAAAIIDHMRMFGRKADENPYELDPCDAVKGALDLMGEQLRLAEIEVVTEYPKACRPVLGHQVQMEQVILNLLTNARDAIKKNPADGGGKITFAVDDTGDDRMRITVSDTGGGIPEECLSQIFEPFFTTKPMGEGTGLGLSVSYGIIHDMGGTIEAENTGGGARFTITLPVAGTDAEKGRSDAI